VDEIWQGQHENEKNDRCPETQSALCSHDDQHEPHQANDQTVNRGIRKPDNISEEPQYESEQDDCETKSAGGGNLVGGVWLPLQLYQKEIERQGSNEIAVTVLRARPEVGESADSGPIKHQHANGGDANPNETKPALCQSRAGFIRGGLADHH